MHFLFFYKLNNKKKFNEYCELYNENFSKIKQGYFSSINYLFTALFFITLHDSRSISVHGRTIFIGAGELYLLKIW